MGTFLAHVGHRRAQGHNDGGFKIGECNVDIEFVVINQIRMVLFSGRGERIRTSDSYVPNVVLYQAELHPELFKWRDSTLLFSHCLEATDHSHLGLSFCLKSCQNSSSSYYLGVFHALFVISPCSG